MAKPGRSESPATLIVLGVGVIVLWGVVLLVFGTWQSNSFRGSVLEVILLPIGVLLIVTGIVKWLRRHPR